MPTCRAEIDRSARGGFTLIELLVVTCLVSIAAGLVIARMDQWLPRWRLRAAARDLARAVRTARHRAVVEERAYVINYWLAEERYDVTRESDAPATDRSSSRLPDGIDLAAIDGGDESSRGFDQVTVRFDPSGIVKGHRIILRDDGGRVLVLVVNALLNQVEFVDG